MTDIEIIPCAYYGSADSGCNAAGPSNPVIVLVVMPVAFGGDQSLRYYGVKPTGDIDWSKPVHVNAYQYDPRSRPWYATVRFVCESMSATAQLD